jgi:hypothetical protein
MYHKLVSLSTYGKIAVTPPPTLCGEDKSVVFALMDTVAG